MGEKTIWNDLDCTWGGESNFEYVSPRIAVVKYMLVSCPGGSGHKTKYMHDCTCSMYRRSGYISAVKFSRSVIFVARHSLAAIRTCTHISLFNFRRQGSSTKNL